MAFKKQITTIDWRKGLIMLGMASFFIVGCKPNNGPEAAAAGSNTNNQPTHRDTLLGRIQALEKGISPNAKLDYTYGATLVKSYLDFFKDYPTDPLSADFLLKSGETAMALNQSDKAVSYYEKLIQFFPASSKAPTAAFMMAFVTDNQIHDFKRAQQLYQKVISDYPKSKLAEDAKAAIQLLGQSDQAVIQKFEKEQVVKQASIPKK